MFRPIRKRKNEIDRNAVETLYDEILPQRTTGGRRDCALGKSGAAFEITVEHLSGKEVQER